MRRHQITPQTLILEVDEDKEEPMDLQDRQDRQDHLVAEAHREDTEQTDLEVHLVPKDHKDQKARQDPKARLTGRSKCYITLVFCWITVIS